MRYSSTRGSLVVAAVAATLNLSCTRKLPQPKIVGCLGLRDIGVGAVADVCVRGDIAFCATQGTLAWSNGLRVVDVSNPEAPRVVGLYSFYPANQVDVRGRYVYAAYDKYSGVLVIDAHEPTRPECVGECTPSVSPDGICALGQTWACTVDDAGVLAMLNVADPRSPVVASTLELPSGATDICAYGSYVCVANGFSGLQVVDVSDPYSPRLAGTWPSEEYPCQVCTEGHYAYVALQHGGLAVLDISSPRKPALVAQYGRSLQGWALYVADGRAYLGVLNSGVHVLDVTTPERPRLIAHMPYPRHPNSISGSGRRVCLADDEFGLLIIEAGSFVYVK